MEEKTSLCNQLAQTPNMILGMKNCDDCIQALRLMVESGMFFSYCPKEAYQTIVDEVRAEFNHATFPAIFIDAQFIGDEKDLKRLLSQNKQ